MKMCFERSRLGLAAGLGLALALAFSTDAAPAHAESRDKVSYNFNAAGAGKAKVKVVRASGAVKSAKSRRAAKAPHRGSPAILAAVRSHAAKAGVPAATALAIVRQESGFNPRARGRHGEIGLMQIKCQTARGMGYSGACSGLYNVSTNLTYGMRYLRAALNRGSVAYYNAGLHAKRLPSAAKRYALAVSGHQRRF